MFSSTVLPVTVMWPGSSFDSMALRTEGMPPFSWSTESGYFPDGFKLHM